MDDNAVIVKMEALATCLCAQIVADGLPAPCFCGLVPGEVPSFDYVDSCTEDTCGMAWVRLALANPTTGIGVINDSVNNCGSEVGFQVEVGIIRCLSPGDSEGKPPPPEDMLAATRLQVADMMTMRRALACCDIGDFILDAYQPYGPTGVAVGGFWLATYSES